MSDDLDLVGRPVDEALDFLEEVSERARAQNSGLVVYPVDYIETVCGALRAVRQQRPRAVEQEERKP